MNFFQKSTTIRNCRFYENSKNYNNTPCIKLGTPLTENNPPFYLCVYFEGSTPAEEPEGVMPGELPQFYMFPCSHVPMKIFLF
jgi:hypothetical protein